MQNKGLPPESKENIVTNPVNISIHCTSSAVPEEEEEESGLSEADDVLDTDENMRVCLSSFFQSNQNLLKFLIFPSVNIFKRTIHDVYQLQLNDTIRRMTIPMMNKLMSIPKLRTSDDV